MTVAANQLVERERVWERVRSVRLETALARTGLAAVALHVLDDSFFQPAPGTNAADHLVSGLVPVAVLAGAVAAYPRLRAGAQAALAVTLGLLGIVIGGAEPAYYWPKEGLSSDDCTGIV